MIRWTSSTSSSVCWGRGTQGSPDSSSSTWTRHSSREIPASSMDLVAHGGYSRSGRVVMPLSDTNLAITLCIATVIGNTTARQTYGQKQSSLTNTVSYNLQIPVDTGEKATQRADIQAGYVKPERLKSLHSHPNKPVTFETCPKVSPRYMQPRTKNKKPLKQ